MLQRQRRQLLALADAMVKGSRKRAQGFGSMFYVGERGNGYILAESCALGAAYEGAFGAPPLVASDYPGEEPVVDGGENAMFQRLKKRFAVLNDNMPDLVNDGRLAPLRQTIVGLNDDEEWTRGRIARWLRRVATA